MIKKYMVLLKAQYTPTKLFNFLRQYEVHKGAVVLYGQVHSLLSLALLKGIKAKRVVSPPVVLTPYDFDVVYDEDDLVLYTGMSDALLPETKQRIRSILGQLSCIKMMKGKNGNIYLLSVKGGQECQLG
jgi:hypothetical protein